MYEQIMREFEDFNIKFNIKSNINELKHNRAKIENQ